MTKAKIIVYVFMFARTCFIISDMRVLSSAPAACCVCVVVFIAVPFALWFVMACNARRSSAPSFAGRQLFSM